MYKNYTKKSGVPYRYVHKLLLVMRLTTVILIATIMQVSASTFGQNITLKVKREPLNKVIDQIRSQSGYDFFFDTELIKKTKPVTIDVTNVPIAEVLEKCLEGQPISFKIENKVVLLKEKEPSALEKIKIALQIPVTVSGKVTDTTGTPLVGATIHIKGHSNGVLAGNDGTFAVSVQIGDELTVSFIGYQPYVFRITENMPFLQIVLHQNYNKLNEVVISTGYQIIPKERATGSFAEVSNDLLNRRVSTDLLSRLEGVVPGLLFNRNTVNGSAGQVDISIRGVNTLFANNQPLVVVDGFPYDGILSNINPNDIDNITILKDAAAASI